MKTYVGRLVKEFYRNESFVIALFRCNEKILYPNGKKSEYFKVKGNFEKIMKTDIEITGEWENKGIKTNNPTFVFQSASLVRSTDKTGAIRYLKSLNGVGDATAKKIYAAFGKDIFTILDANPEKLLEIKGISEKKARRILADYIAHTVAKELFAYLYGYRMAENKIRKIYNKYKNDAIDLVKTEPHRLFLEGLLSFEVAEKIMEDEGLDPLSVDRQKSVVLKTLQATEVRGDTFTPVKELSISACKKLGLEFSTKEEGVEAMRGVFAIIKSMIGEYLNIDAEGKERYIYRKQTYKAEHSVATNIQRLARANGEEQDFYPEIEKSEAALGFTLSDEQKFAVNSVLNNSVSIVTGGPGTGKTSFISVLLETFRRLTPKGNIVLGAPTGRAARRMMQQTGCTARTLHSILKIAVDDEGVAHEEGLTHNDFMDADLIIIDETSMLDIFLAEKVFDSINEGTRVALVGDIHQLPSVGAGTVFKSLIDSNAIPVCRFTKIFRQGDGSTIAQNALKINQGNNEVVYDDAFWFIESTSDDIPSLLTSTLYEKAVEKYGVEEVAVLTPYRKTTASGVNGLNPRLKGVFNPYVEASPTTKVKGMELYDGDRVMFTRNEEDLANGDIGTITKIYIKDGEQYVDIRFDDGKESSLFGESLHYLVPAFATTVHKSQGSEYKCVIMVIDEMHKTLLKRNLIYTGVTRAKEKVVLVGSKKAFNKGVLIEDTNSRKSRLAELINLRD